MVRTISSNRCIFIVRTSTIGSGDPLGIVGIRLGTGAIGRDGGTHMLAGHMTGTGIVATPIITTTTAALSVKQERYVAATMTCIGT